MSKKILLLLFGIILLGFFLRIHNLYTWPRFGATFDEYAWTWQGINIIQNGTPVSWSPHPQYGEYELIRYQNTPFRIVAPFLEHPPVFGVIAGSFALLNGADNMYDVSLQKIRPLAVILGITSIILVFLLTQNIYGARVGLWASLLYATVPTIVVGSRIVQNENFFIPSFLLVLFLISRYLKTKRKLFRNIAIAICSILILAKIPWIAASIAVIGILLFHKKYKDVVVLLVSVVLAFAAFAAYGYLYDWNLFVNLWKLQANRYDITFNSIFALFQKPFLVDRHYTDGWILFGWFAFIILLTQDLKKNIFIVAPVVAYFLIFLAGIPDEAGHGWYRYPFYPFLIISIALFIKEYFVKNMLLTFLFLVIVGTSLFANTWEVVFGFSYFIFRISIISWLLVLTPYIPKFNTKMKFATQVGYGWLIIFIFMNVWAVFLYNEQ